jgi:hypothetical protein|tara:strand:+ start:700 stop:915 length:216 start_codon:yes stop_codon:yes gene_type:complete
VKTTTIELTKYELFRVEMALVQYKVDLERDITTYTEHLNGSNNTTEVKLYTELIHVKREKLKDINNILNKI